MSKNGLKLAISNGENRPVHKTRQEAEQYYFLFRNEALKDIEKLAVKYPEYRFDFSPESLKEIEKLYFVLLENSNYAQYSFFGLTLKRMEELIAIYYGQVYIANTRSHWVVEKDPFVSDRYYLAIKFDNNFMTIECSRKTNHYQIKGNARQQSLYREFRKHEEFA